VCAKCGAPWERVVEVEHVDGGPKWAPNSGNRAALGDVSDTSVFRTGLRADTKTLGWQPTCSCGTDELKRSVVLDPFAGSGTVGVVARLNHCDFIGIELNPEYIAIAERRLSQEVFSF